MVQYSKISNKNVKSINCPINNVLGHFAQWWCNVPSSVRWRIPVMWRSHVIQQYSRNVCYIVMVYNGYTVKVVVHDQMMNESISDNVRHVNHKNNNDCFIREHITFNHCQNWNGSECFWDPCPLNAMMGRVLASVCLVDYRHIEYGSNESVDYRHIEYGSKEGVIFYWGAKCSRWGVNEKQLIVMW